MNDPLDVNYLNSTLLENVTRKWLPNENDTSAIPILVFVCDRTSVRYHLRKLLKLRPSPTLFPIIVSQDCRNKRVTKILKSFGDEITHIENPTDKPSDASISSWHIGYHRIARHYKKALDYVFLKNFSYVIMTEDDLDINQDFYNYFANSKRLLEDDPTLWCVSAWNDNGRMVDSDASALLYRTDFFPGLGWMTTKKIWEELSPKWPEAYWDDWMRSPEQRKGRQCIRPEVSRTVMTKYGKKGVSSGQFFQTMSFTLFYTFVDFSLTNLTYLTLTAGYKQKFFDEVYKNSEYFDENKIRARTLPKSVFIRFQYSSTEEFEYFANELGLMSDFKSGVPRTAYEGIVTCFVGNYRVYITPNQKFIRDYEYTPITTNLTLAPGAIRAILKLN